MVKIYNQEEIEIMTEGGQKLAEVMLGLKNFLQVGVTYHEIEMETRRLIQEIGATSGTIGYQTQKSDPPFPCATCISVNSQVAHGIGYKNETLVQEGDLVSLDVIIVWKGMFIDNCRSYIVGESTIERERLAVKELGGHGVGEKIHMEPFVPSFGGSGYATPLKEGMILAIEPIITAGDWRIKLLDDGWTFVTKDGSDTSQFEETVLITKDGPVSLTKDL